MAKLNQGNIKSTVTNLLTTKGFQSELKRRGIEMSLRMIRHYHTTGAWQYKGKPASFRPERDLVFLPMAEWVLLPKTGSKGGRPKGSKNRENKGFRLKYGKMKEDAHKLFNKNKK